MAKSLLCAYLLAFSSVSLAQQTIWIETFEDLTSGDVVDNGATAWSVSNDGSFVFSVQNVQNYVAGGDDLWFTARNTTGSGSNNADTWMSEAIDISAYNQNNTNTGVNISIDLYETGGLEDAEDYIRVYYTLDGVGSAATTALTNGIQEGNYDYEFAYALAIGQNSTATSLRIVVEMESDNNGEQHHIDNVRVFEPGVNFTEVATAAGLNLGGNKDGGHAWADFNNDGCLDLIVNRNGVDGKLYTQVISGIECQGTFTDVTNTFLSSWNGGLERSVVWGDFNNDGYIDFAHNSNEQIEIYLNRGPDGSGLRAELGIPDTEPDYSFGLNDADNDPNFILNAENDPDHNTFNTEGVMWVDYNLDGWLDLVADNHQSGTFALEKIVPTNTATCYSAGFTEQIQDSTGLSQLLGGADGDYSVTADFDDDGDQDILLRKEGGQNDLFFNNRIDGGVWNPNTPYFTHNTNFGDDDNDAANGDKGGVAFCDFDNDGDFDLVWTNNGVNQIWEQTGLNSGSFTKRGLPKYMIDANDVDGCACGDMDLDGDMDLIMTDNAGESFVMINNFDASIPTQNFTFSRYFNATAAGGINVNGNGESTSFVDYDNDGDLDIYVVKNGANNQLWRNNLLSSASADADKKYLKVRVMLQNPTTITTQIFERNLVGSTMILYNNAMDEIVGGIREINGGRGHGSQDPNIITYAVDDPTATYKLVVKTPAINDSRIIDTISIIPNTPNTPLLRNDQTYTVAYSSSDFEDFETCNVTILPVELLFFRSRVEKETNRVWLEWETVTELDNDFFTLERSTDGIFFEPIAIVEGAGNSKVRLFYDYEDPEPQSGITYYRLKQTDFDGKFNYSRVVQVNLDDNVLTSFGFYPNPTNGEEFTLQSYMREDSKINVELYSLDGKLVYTKHFEGQTGDNEWQIQLPKLLAGMYIAHIKTDQGKVIGSSKVLLMNHLQSR